MDGVFPSKEPFSNNEYLILGAKSWLHYAQIQHSLLWKALTQVYGPKGMEFCS